MKAMTEQRCRAENCRARNIYFSFREALRGVIPYFFFLLCHMQIVLLTIANTKYIIYLPK